MWLTVLKVIAVIILVMEPASFSTLQFAVELLGGSSAALVTAAAPYVAVTVVGLGVIYGCIRATEPTSKKND